MARDTGLNTRHACKMNAPCKRGGERRLRWAAHLWSCCRHSPRPPLLPLSLPLLLLLLEPQAHPFRLSTLLSWQCVSAEGQRSAARPAGQR